jgi:hypothetical protein
MAVTPTMHLSQSSNKEAWVLGELGTKYRSGTGHVKVGCLQERAAWSLYIHPLHEEQKMFLPFALISPHFCLVILHFLPNKLYYYFHYKKQKKTKRVTGKLK